MFFRSKKKQYGFIWDDLSVSVTWDEFSFKKCHSKIMEVANIWIEKAENNEERILLLDYLIDTILADACTGKLFLPLLTHPKMPLPSPFPTDFYDQSGVCKSIQTDEKVNVSLSGSTPVYLCPWEKDRCANAILNIAKTKFVCDDNHKSYYTDIGLCEVYSGNHSINAGRYLKKGEITASVRRAEMLYPHCYTDGSYWYNSHTNEKLFRVGDFRFAAAYSLTQPRVRYKNTNQA